MMHNYINAALFLFSTFVLYRIVTSVVTSRHHARRAAELGCKPPLSRPYRYPFGVDMVWRLIKADKAQVIPDEIVAIYDELKVNTWSQNMLGDSFIVTVDPKNIQAVLATQFNDFALGELRTNNFFPLLGNGIFTTDGKSWEHSRALLRPQFARDQIANLEQEELHVQNFFRHLPTNLDANDGWTSSVDLSPLFFRLTLDSATEFLFGESVQSQVAAMGGITDQVEKAGDGGKLNWTSFASCFDGATETLGTRTRLFEKYWLYNPSSFKEQCKQVHKLVDYYVNLALTTDLSSLKESGMQKGYQHEKYIFLHELVATTRDPVELRSQLLNILLAGRDTTAGLLGWTFYLLVRHPEVYDKLRRTILEEFGTNSRPGDITFVNLKACVYLQHVLREALRLYSVVPMNSRRAVRDTTIPVGGGPDGTAPVYVKKGQEVNYYVHIMHRRKDLWGPDADEFKPDRWVGRKVGWEFLPFNGGPRICLGQQFALTKAGYIVVRIMQRFDKIVNEEMDPIVRHAFHLTTSPAAVKVRMHEARN